MVAVSIYVWQWFNKARLVPIDSWKASSITLEDPHNMIWDHESVKIKHTGNLPPTQWHTPTHKPRKNHFSCIYVIQIPSSILDYAYIHIREGMLLSLERSYMPLLILQHCCFQCLQLILLDIWELACMHQPLNEIHFCHLELLVTWVS